jgi:hypothetical protein
VIHVQPTTIVRETRSRDEAQGQGESQGRATRCEEGGEGGGREGRARRRRRHGAGSRWRVPDVPDAPGAPGAPDVADVADTEADTDTDANANADPAVADTDVNTNADPAVADADANTNADPAVAHKSAVATGYSTPLHVVLALVSTACAASATAPAPIANRIIGGPIALDWRASEAADARGESLDITLAISGRVVARDLLCCTVVVAAQCRPHDAGSNSVSFECADELTRWEAELVPGAIVVTRVDTFLDSPQSERRKQIARITTTATSLVVAR